MNRSNISKQLNYGDLSRFVGKPVGQQFANKRYAEGDMVADELTESVVFEDVNGNKRTYNYNPKTHTKPNSSGRMRKINVDYTQLGNNPGINIFDQAQVTVDPIKTEGQQQDVPVSIAEDAWSGSDLPSNDGKSKPLMTKPSSVKSKLDQVKIMAGLIGVLPGGSFLGPLFSKYGIENVKDSLLETADLKNELGFDDEGNMDEGNMGEDPDRGTAAALLNTGKIDFDDTSQAGKVEGAAKGITAQQNMTAFGLSTDKDGNVTSGKDKIGLTLNDLAENTMTREALGKIYNEINAETNTSMSLFGGNEPEFGGNRGFETPDLGEYDPDDTKGNADAYFDQQKADEEAEANAIGDMYSGIDDFSYGPMAAGGIAQLSSGGIAPSDKHLDPGSFVLSADVVSGVGDGSTEAGIERMSGLLGIPLDGSVDGPDGSMLGRVTTADGGPVPGTGLSDSVSTVIQDTGPIRLNVGNNPLKQMTPQGKTAARVARDELVVDTKTIANLPQMFMGTKGPDLKQGQEMLTNFMANVRANKTNTGGKQPGPLVPEGQDVMKGLASLFQRA